MPGAGRAHSLTCKWKKQKFCETRRANQMARNGAYRCGASGGG
jgi:predicted SprT family Zn-dependent metalloprotease